MVRFPMGIGTPFTTGHLAGATSAWPATGKFVRIFETAESAAMDLSVAKLLAVGASSGVAEPCPCKVVYSYAPKKKNLSLTIGPPNVPPNRLLSKGGCVVIVPLLRAALVRLSMAFRFLFCAYHSPEPCQLFVPVLVTRINWPPEEWPYSALNWFVSSTNSPTASGITVEFGPVTPKLLSSTPSTTKLFSLGRVPPTDPPTPTVPPGCAMTLGASIAKLKGLPFCVPPT